MNSFRIAQFIVLILLLPGCKPTPPAPILSLEGGWVRAMPPAMKMTAAYGSFTNHGPQTIEITSFSSDSFADVSLHLTKIEDGVSKMEQLPALLQAPGTSTMLEPGGLHLMLTNPTREIHPGDLISLTLIASSGQQYRFSLPVESR